MSERQGILREGNVKDGRGYALAPHGWLVSRRAVLAARDLVGSLRGRSLVGQLESRKGSLLASRRRGRNAAAATSCSTATTTPSSLSTSRSRGRTRSFFERSDHGHLDLPRAVEGRFGGGLFAICVPPSPTGHDLPDFDAFVTDTGYEVPLPPPLDPAYAQQMTIAVMARLFRLETESNGRLKVVRDAEELMSVPARRDYRRRPPLRGRRRARPRSGRPRRLLRGGAALVGHRLEPSQRLCRRRALPLPRLSRYRPRPQRAGEGACPRRQPAGRPPRPLPPERAGILGGRRPNRCAARRHPRGGPRPLCLAAQPDRQAARRRRRVGGVVGIAFHVGNLRADGRPDADTPLAEIVRHIDYIAGRIGIDHVALGSDFDGAVMPLELGDVAGLPKLVEALRGAGYDDAACAR